MKMDKYKELYESLTKCTWSELLTNEYIMDMYRGYIEDDPPHYVFDDDYLVEDKIDNFNEMMNDRGKRIIFNLYSDIKYGDNAEAILRIEHFASQIAENDGIFEIAAWEGEFGDYMRYIDTFIKKIKGNNYPMKKKRK